MILHSINLQSSDIFYHIMHYQTIWHMNSHATFRDLMTWGHGTILLSTYRTQRRRRYHEPTWISI